MSAVVYVGDSNARGIGLAAARYQASLAVPQFEVVNGAVGGTSIAGGDIATPTMGVTVRSGEDEWWAHWADLIDAHAPVACVVFHAGAWELPNRSEYGKTMGFNTAAGDYRYQSALEVLIRILRKSGAPLAVLDCPYFYPTTNFSGTWWEPSTSKVDHLNALITSATGFDGVSVWPLNYFVAHGWPSGAQGGGALPAPARAADGVHFTEAGYDDIYHWMSGW